MRFGVCLPQYGRDVSVDELRTTAQRAEALGFDSVWVSDHVVTPQHLQDSMSPTFYDAFVTLSFAAAFTQRIRLGTTVIVVPYRNPIVTAKMLATLDVLSQGRVVFGVGAGGAPDEFRALGVPSNRRGSLTDEYLRVMVALWAQDPTSFKGRYFSFESVRFAPKPVQTPHPPIWVGGRSDAALRRAVTFGEAWHPTAMPLAALKERMSELRRLAVEAGRQEGPMVTVHQSMRFSDDGAPDDKDRPGRGTPEQFREDMRVCQELGITDVVCNFGSFEAEEMARAMETFAKGVMARLSTPGDTLG